MFANEPGDPAKVFEWLDRLGELELDETNDLETRSLCSAVVRSAWNDVERARIQLAARRWEAPDARAEAFSNACRITIDLEKAARFVRGRRLDFWASLLELTTGELEAIRERFVEEAEPLARELRSLLERHDSRKLREFSWTWGDLDA